jgi:hypothetical protein
VAVDAGLVGGTVLTNTATVARMTAGVPSSAIVINPGPIGAEPTNPIAITSTELVGQPLNGQTFSVDIFFQDNKYVEYAPTSGAGGIAVAALTLEYGSILIPTGASQGSHGFLDREGTFQNFGPNGTGSGTLHFIMAPAFPDIVIPETFNFYGLRYNFTLPTVADEFVVDPPHPMWCRSSLTR